MYDNWDNIEYIKFYLFCCEKVKQLAKPMSLKAIELAERWVEDKSSVSREELWKAVHDSFDEVNDLYKSTYLNECDTRKACSAAYQLVRGIYHNDNICYNNTITYQVTGAIGITEEQLYREYTSEKLFNIMEDN